MALGLVPAAIVGLALIAGVVALAVFLDPIVRGLTPFVEAWDEPWRGLARLVVALALVVGTVTLAARTFTAVTLLVGAPFYDRIQRVADDDRGPVDERDPGFWRMLGATIAVVAQSVLASLVVVLVGLIPAVGSIAGPVLGFALTAAALTRELTLNPLARRGLLGSARRRALRGAGARSFGFGVAVQLCYLVPLGAVITMPAAVAGSALLTRDILERSALSAPGTPPPGPAAPVPA